MKYLIITFSLLSLLICQTTEKIDELHSDLIEVFEYDENGRVTSSRFINRVNNISETTVDREFDIIKEVDNSPREIFEIDTNGRVTSSKYIDQDYNIPKYTIEREFDIIKEVDNSPNEIFEIDTDGRIVEK